jgi:four helix bundle protein
MGSVQHFQQLETWQESHKLVLMVYQITKGFPSDERYGLISQKSSSTFSSFHKT